MNTAQTVNDLKSHGYYYAAGVVAHSLGHDDNYGCHFGMRSTVNFAREEYKRGWNDAHDVEIDKTERRGEASYYDMVTNELELMKRLLDDGLPEPYTSIEGYMADYAADFSWNISAAKRQTTELILSPEWRDLAAEVKAKHEWDFLDHISVTEEKQLFKALVNASNHLDYCGYGDRSRCRRWSDTGMGEAGKRKAAPNQETVEESGSRVMAKTLQISDDLRNFLSKWLDWAENTETRINVYNFEPRFGLCSNLTMCNIDFNDDEDGTYKLSKELEKLLREDYGEEWGYPFGQHDYFLRRENGTQHHCAKRRLWVRKTLERS